MFLGLTVAVLSLLIDQISKFFIDVQIIPEPKIIPVNDYFNLVKVWNTGVSFSMFNNHGFIGSVVLCCVALLISAVLLYWMYHEKNRLKIIGLGIIIGGAMGNVIDRVRFGAVLDFLDFHYKNYHWPAFNLADSFICVGAVLLIIFELYNEKTKRSEK